MGGSTLYPLHDVTDYETYDAVLAAIEEVIGASVAVRSLALDDPRDRARLVIAVWEALGFPESGSATERQMHIRGVLRRWGEAGLL